MHYYITSLHYKNNLIELSETSKKHLIVTGRNGAGKTSLLKSIRNQLNEMESYSSNFKKNEKYSELIEHLAGLSDTNPQNKALWDNLIGLLINGQMTTTSKMKRFLTLDFNVPMEDMLKKRILNNGFVLAFFDSKRTFSFEAPQGITVNEKKRFSMSEKASTHFIRYLVNLKAERAFAYQEGNMDVVQSIDIWFSNFEDNLRELFETDILELKFDRHNLAFKVILENKTMDLLHLSDGFSSIIYIISEIIMRMKNKRKHKAEGIVIIDEIETHLHVSLQKKILRFLENFFPNIQFIVSTHSPFILSSLSNAIVYDLETQQRIEDMSGFSYDSIVENYFNTDQYSDLIKLRMDEYLHLLNSPTPLTESQETYLTELTNYFKQIPDESAPELKYKFYESTSLRKSDRN
ncbi:AAA family ATPase [Paenibacillus lautus]|uniref:AAA family ATPase n=1 Tax=Paenibacillus lautus TaxID=1401 RepID=UPI002DB8A273|nr:AAA family ATPase [Paenibacillus lautus]MEC0259737.1 AAA family ATPase [Paenibacillus lautus]